jgi:hypothetical protein
MPADEEGGRGQSRTSQGPKLSDRLSSSCDDHGLTLGSTIDDLTPVITEVPD